MTPATPPRTPTGAPTLPEVLLAIGSPHFRDAALNDLAARAGQAAAWQAAFADDPVAAMSHASGGFAVAVRSPDGAVMLAVDRFAICSLCYAVVGDQLRFGERADEVVAPGGDLDPQALFDYLYLHVIPSPRTVFAGVRRLPAGHLLRWQHGQLSLSRHWSPRFSPPTGRARFADLRSEFRGLLDQAVRRHGDLAQPACFLSGGTDSSTVAGLLAQACPSEVTGYSIGFDADGYDEMSYARIAAKRFGIRHREHYVTPSDLVASIPGVAAHYDQPFGNSSAVPAYHCALMARNDGVRTILAGDGGDELFGGNLRYAKQRIFGVYDSVPQALKDALIEPLANWRAGHRLPPLRKLHSYVAQASVAMPARMEGYNLLLRLGMTDVITPDFLAAVDTQGPARLQAQVWQDIDASDPLNHQLAYDWRFTLSENDLPKVCGTAGLAQLGVGFPLLDADLVDFSLRLPTAYKLRGLTLRWFFKEALRGFLPEEIIRKKKHGFGLPFGVWATRDAALKSLATDSLRSLGSRGLVRAPFIDDLLANKLPQHPGYYGEMVWILMMLEQWLRVHRPDYRLA